MNPTTSPNPDALPIDRGRAVLLVIDLQELLCAAMPAKILAQTRRNVTTLIAMARRFGLPIVISQQYPRGLGPTLADIEDAVAGADDLHRFDKVEFSVCEASAFPLIRESLGDARDQWIVTGAETHVCVYQTVRQLARAGDAVHVPRDAVISRTHANWQVGLDLVARAGAVVTSTETVLFDALGQAGTDDFKVLAKLVR